MTRVRIGPLAHGGGAVARLADGRVAFVSDACPGDEAIIEITEDHGRWLSARISEIVSPSPERITPPCPYAGECGGCQWQHISYPTQVAAKQAIVADAFERIGRLGDTITAPCIPSPRALGYRNKVELVAGGEGGSLHLGFHRRGSEELVPVDRCLLLPPALQNAPKALRGALRFLSGRHGDLGLLRVGIRAASHTKDVEVALWTRPGPFPRSMVARTVADAVRATGVVRILTKGAEKERRATGVEVLSGRGAWRERLNSAPYLISAPSFFQVNSAATENLVRLAIEALGTTLNGRILDLFAGAGTFTVPLSRHAEEVVAVESSRYALADLRRNLEANGTWADVVGGDAAREIAGLGEFDGILVDPPRSGLGGELVSALSAAAPTRIVYVSCDPATLARDAALLTASGYNVTSVQPVDLFPQTYHVETVALFERRSTGCGPDGA